MKKKSILSGWIFKKKQTARFGRGSSFWYNPVQGAEQRCQEKFDPIIQKDVFQSVGYLDAPYQRHVAKL